MWTLPSRSGLSFKNKMDDVTLLDLLECPVCLEKLDVTAKVLLCQHTFWVSSPEDFQGPQGAEVPRVQDPGVLRYRGAASQPVACAPKTACGPDRARGEGVLPPAWRADPAGRQEEQDSPQRSAVQSFPAGA